MPELGQKNFFQAPEAVKVQIGLPAQKVHGKDQPSDAEVVVTMQVAYKDVIDFLLTELVPTKLVLGALPTIYQELVMMKLQMLGSREPPVSRKRTGRAQNC